MQHKTPSLASGQPIGKRDAIARPIARAASGEPGTEQELAAYRLLVSSLFSSPASMILSNLIGTFVVAYCWYITEQSTFKWLTAVSLVIFVARVLTVVRYLKHGQNAVTFREIRGWDREFFVGSTAMSIALGATNFSALVHTSSDAAHLITTICGVAFGSGYVARNAGRPTFVIVQLMCFVVPMVAGLLLASEAGYPVIAAYMALYAVTNILIAFSLNRNLLQLAAATRESGDLAESLRHQNVTLDSALNSMTHGLCMLTRDLRIEVVNSRFLELYGLRAGEIAAGMELNEVVERLVRSHIISRTIASDLVHLCRRTVEIAQSTQLEIQTESDQVFVISVEVAGSDSILMLTEDASARKAAAIQIERMARCDLLTDLPNRFRFIEVLAGLISAPGRRIALYYIDLDDFKGVNDTLGHEAGDQLLIEVARRLRGLMAEGGFIGRFGGDEFLILSDVTGADQAKLLGDRILAALAEPMELAGTMLTVTTSVGIALAPEHGEEPSTLLRAADMALYAAKNEGRNTAVLYTPALAEKLSHRRQLEHDLREAARTGRLSLHYQPIVDARTDQLRSYEALMRWHHPEKGMISPVEFIPIAEQTGLIVQMGDWALRQACLDARTWPDHVSVAVNISASQFKDAAHLIGSVKDALLISGLDPHRLELEVTESLLIVNQDATLDAIRALRRIGVRFSLDDFGTGYSSLAYLARYPFSKVKIDRSFAEQITSDSPSRSIIEVVCQLAVKLGMRVVVEGIETEEQRREIVALGAEQAQGWLFGRPKALEDLAPARQRTAA